MDTHDTGLERRLDLLRQQSTSHHIHMVSPLVIWIPMEADSPPPIDILCKKRMPPDLLRAIAPQPLRRIPVQKTGHDALRLGRHVCGELKRVGENALVHRVDVLVVERGEASL